MSSFFLCTISHTLLRSRSATISLLDSMAALAARRGYFHFRTQVLLGPALHDVHCGMKWSPFLGIGIRSPLPHSVGSMPNFHIISETTMGTWNIVYQFGSSITEKFSWRRIGRRESLRSKKMWCGALCLDIAKILQRVFRCKRGREELWNRRWI